MQANAMVNYHIASPDPQAIHIDAGGIEGKLVWPELVPTKVNVEDIRGAGQPIQFWKDSIQFFNFESSVQDFSEESGWRDQYEQEIRSLLINSTGAKEVLIFDHTLREDDPDAGRKPARNVHTDYSESGALQRLKDLLGPDEVEKWQQGHFGFVNLWRPLERKVTHAPLGFVKTDSVARDDWQSIDLVYPDRLGQILGLSRNPAHQWFYLANMAPNEIVLFNIYDNKGLAPMGHSAIDMEIDRDENKVAKRKSLETRTLIRYE